MEKTNLLTFEHDVGIVRAPLLTTAMQVASRFVLVWGIVDQFPATTAFDPLYSSMLFAWSATEVIRYSYFAINLYFKDVPDFLLWLRWVLHHESRVSGIGEVNTKRQIQHLFRALSSGYQQ